VPPTGAICVTVAHGDLDGDGTPDTAVVWGDPAPPPSEGGKHQWHLAAVTSTATYETQFETAFFEGAIRGIIDVNADGRGQILVHVDHGASTEAWEAFMLVGSSLKQVTTTSGASFILGMYGSVMHGSRFDCVSDQAGVRLLSVMGFGGRTLPSGDVLFDWTVHNYRIRAAQAVLVGTSTGTVTRTEMDDPASPVNSTWPSPWQSTTRIGQCGLRVP
jgi:hypothetical protein